MDMITAQVTAGYAQAKALSATAQGTLGAGVAAATEGFAQVLARHEAEARAALTGGGDPQALVQAISASQMAVETVTTLRDRVVEAYQEILRMPV